jgi:GNAT superfamily N-acetyltransferase
MNQQNPVSIRQATIFDVDSLAPLFDAYRQFYRQASDLELARQFLFARLRNDQSIVFLAIRQDDSAVGFAQLFPSFSSASAARIFILNDLYVQPEVHRQGVKLLLTAAAQFGNRASGAVRANAFH